MPLPTTVDGLRENLAALGLDVRGQKWVLIKRLKKAMKKERPVDVLEEVSAALKEEANENGGKERDGKNVQEEEQTEAKKEEVKADVKEKEKEEVKEEVKEEEVKKVKKVKEEKEKKRKIKPQPFDYYLCFDIEATCERGKNFAYPNEIIEFPVVLLDGRTFEIVDEFQSYVKPSINPTLTEFCIELTGIQQSTIDASPSFIEVLDAFQIFMTKYSLFQDKSAAFITDGPFDIRDFITKQCAHSSIRRPTYFSLPWVDVRPLFRDNFNELALRNIEAMLDKLGLEFEGRQHSGLDDARNVGRIVKWLAEDGVVVKANRKWHGVMGPGRSADSVNGRKNGPWWKRK